MDPLPQRPPRHRTYAATSETEIPHDSLPVVAVSAPKCYNFEYLDHTADIQIHSWGASLAAAFESGAIGMFNYMIELESVGIDESQNRTFRSSGHDMESLLYGFLDDCLYLFTGDLFVLKEINIDHFDRETWQISASA